MTAEEKPNWSNREMLPEVDLYPHFWHPIINDDKQSTFNSLAVKKKLLIGKADFFVKLFDNRCLEQNFLVFSHFKKNKKR